MKNIEKLQEDFYANKNVCTDPKEFKIGDLCAIMDPNILSDDMQEYAIIPCRVVGAFTGNIPGRKYYVLKAEGSKNDEALNTMMDPYITDPFYKILENTSPYIM